MNQSNLLLELSGRRKAIFLESSQKTFSLYPSQHYLDDLISYVDGGSLSVYFGTGSEQYINGIRVEHVSVICRAKNHQPCVNSSSIFSNR